jgi:hypothetical protein
MANREHLAALKKGAKNWNRWRAKRGILRPNLRLASLHDANLSGADLSGADLTAANLYHADLYEANLCGAILQDTTLRWADLGNCDLSKACLRLADLSQADFTEAVLAATDFTYSIMAGTKLDNLDLSVAHGLDEVAHEGPSSIGIDTVYRSRGNIPQTFLRGAGVSDDFINLIKSLVGKIHFYSCFISYSNKDHGFAKQLHADLQSAGVRCWFAPEDLKIGERLRPSFDEAIQLHDKLLVILSENSVRSQWVEKEVETAFEKERNQNRVVLFPIRLDDAIMQTKQAWAADIRRTRHIGDFRNWKDDASYRNAFDRLLRDLKAEYKADSAVQSD